MVGFAKILIILGVTLAFIGVILMRRYNEEEVLSGAKPNKLNELAPVTQTK